MIVCFIIHITKQLIWIIKENLRLDKLTGVERIKNPSQNLPKSSFQHTKACLWASQMYSALLEQLQTWDGQLCKTCTHIQLWELLNKHT